MRKAIFLLVIVLVLTFVSVSQAGGLFCVDVNGPNDPGTGSFDDPFRRIQDAVDVAVSGDIVEIRAGLYTGLGNYDIDPNGKSITIRSIDPNDSNVVANTIIDPNGAGRGFYFDSGEDANCVISGLTIRNGYTGGKGGGVYCYNSSPTITNCIISGNSAGTHGGGLFCQNSDLQIIGCVISSNTSANDGGGIEHWRGKSVVTNCIISDNLANGVGGGADYFDSDDIILTNCTFVKNSADSGGGFYSWGSDVSVKNSILWANEATEGSQVALDTSGSVSIDYSDVQGGETAVDDPGDGLIWDSNNIDSDPCFAFFSANGDPNVWDFHLQSVYGRWDANSQSWVTDSNTSPCIDAGNPNSNWIEELWPNGKRINMGVYGGTNQASKNGNIADFDVSGAVDNIDLDEFVSEWLSEEDNIVNLNLTGFVDFADFALFADNWLWQQP
ncbi:MAG: hypothetical protein KAS75_05030 [Planctomycetes bacterium]|nr:hypothetical protein [Planctomycetota bacterium]